MPVDDHRIERALHDAAPVVDTDRVLDRIATKRTRRRQVRRMQLGALALVAALVIGATTLLLTGDDGPSPHVAAPGSQLSARVVDGNDPVGGGAGRLATPKPVVLDADPGPLQGPLFAGSSALALASYDPVESSTHSHVVRVDGTHVVDVVDFKAHVMSITEGEGARWALTRNLIPTGAGTVPDAFLKRIAADGRPTSVPLPRDADPVGPVAAIGGAVWVPTRVGVEQFDTNGAWVRTILLTPADTRSVVAIGKFAWVTDGAAGLRRLDPTSGATDETRVAASGAAHAAAGDSTNGWVLVDPGAVVLVDRDLRPTVTVTLPKGFAATTVTVADGRAWASGTVDGAPAIVLLDARGVRSTVILENGRDAALAWTAANTVTAVSDGRLVTIHVS